MAHVTAANHPLAIIMHPKININQAFNNVRLSKLASYSLKLQSVAFWGLKMIAFSRST